MPADTPPAVLTESEWQFVSDRMPIPCVDLLPVVRAADGSPAHIGLILRNSPWGLRWCHLGGRVLYGETLREACERHLRTSVTSPAETRIADEPYMMNQYFKDARPGMGHDPRKHAVASCYLVDFAHVDGACATGDEAREFRWFAADHLPPEPELWPGTSLMLPKARASRGARPPTGASE